MRYLKLFIIVFSIFVAFELQSCGGKRPVEPQTVKNITNPKYYYKLGVANLQGGELSQALYYLKKAYKLAPNDPKILNALGIAYARAGEKDKSREMFLKAIKIAPELGESYTNLGVLYASEGKYDKAIKYLKLATEADEYKNKDKAFFNLAIIYKKNGNDELFEEYLKKALTFNPYRTKAYILLGEFYLKQKRYLDAFDIYLTALNMGIGEPEIYLGLGKSHYYLKNIEKAKYYLRKVVKIAKRNKPLVADEAETFLKKIEKEERLGSKRGETNIVREDFFIKKPTKEKKDEYEYSTGRELPPASKPIQKPKWRYKSYLEDEQPVAKRKKVRAYGSKYKRKRRPRFVYKYFLQLGLFSSVDNAKKLALRVKAFKVKPKIIKEKIGKTVYYRVIIGYFKSSTEAKNARKKLIERTPFFRRAIIKYVKTQK